MHKNKLSAQNYVQIMPTDFMCLTIC